MDRDGGSTANRKGPFPVPNPTVPYWRTQPHWIDEYRSTDTLPAECDICIIGAGMSGVATAYHLSQLAGPDKPSIVLLEARAICSGATGRNGGHVKAKATTVYDKRKKFGPEAAEEVVAFYRRQVYALKHTVEAEGLDCEYELRRTFDVFLDTKEAKEMEQKLRTSQKAGEAWTRETDFIPESRVEQVRWRSSASRMCKISCAYCWSTRSHP